MFETEYHVVIACPQHWNENTVRILAARLATELTEYVSVYVWKLEDGRIVEQTVVEVGDDAA
jgi:hypothetical protein